MYPCLYNHVCVKEYLTCMDCCLIVIGMSVLVYYWKYVFPMCLEYVMNALMVNQPCLLHCTCIFFLKGVATNINARFLLYISFPIVNAATYSMRGDQTRHLSIEYKFALCIVCVYVYIGKLIKDKGFLIQFFCYKCVQCKHKQFFLLLCL